MNKKSLQDYKIKHHTFFDKLVFPFILRIRQHQPSVTAGAAAA